MKKKNLLAGVAMLLTAAAVTGYSAYSKTDASDLLNANVEALASGESSQYHGRWRTVGCNGQGVENWRTYCCPHDYYDNCPGPGSCNGTAIGC